MKVYIPFNMIIDTDFGVIRLLEKTQNIEPLSTNKIKSFLIKRKNENPIPEYCELNGIDKGSISNYAYDVILDKFYKSVLNLSEQTDLISLAINTHKLGLSKELKIVVGCDEELEVDFLHSILSKMKFDIECVINEEIKLNDFDYIFIKVLDQPYIDYLLDIEKISGKRIYIADYNFNTLQDKNTGIKIISPIYQLQLENEGNVINTVSIYNKRRT